MVTIAVRGENNKAGISTKKEGIPMKGDDSIFPVHRKSELMRDHEQDIIPTPASIPIWRLLKL